MSFAVIDFETTGLMPGLNDRVIEVGIVLMNSEGLLEHEWTTLVNPRRDVGATRVHGLQAKDLLKTHDAGGSVHTAKYKPWKLVSYHAFADKRKAQEFEYYLKSGSGKAFANKRLWPTK